MNFGNPFDAVEFAPQVDFRIEDHGSVWLFRPLSSDAAKWLKETTPDDAQFLGEALAVEPRYMVDVMSAAAAAGLVQA